MGVENQAQFVSVLRKALAFEMVAYGGPAAKPPSNGEIAEARAAGVWREPELIGHDDLLERIRVAFRAVRKEDVVRAFLAGIGRGEPRFRSAISSWAIARHLQAHDAEFISRYGPCAVCGVSRSLRENGLLELDFNLSVVDRFDYGGSSSLAYVLIDLEDFAATPLPDSSDKDWEALRGLLSVIESAPPNFSIGKLPKLCGAIAGKNQMQRTRTLEVLAILGVLEPKAAPSYRLAFPRYMDRVRPDGKNDWDYPAIHWKGSDGIDRQAVEDWFGLTSWA